MQPQQLLKKIFVYVEEQKRDVQAFYQNQQATMTGLYRANYYAELMQNTMKRINYYLTQRKRLPAAEYEKNQSNIAVETAILRATQREMNEQLAGIKRISDEQERLSKRMIRLRKELERSMGEIENATRQR